MTPVLGYCFSASRLSMVRKGLHKGDVTRQLPAHKCMTDGVLLLRSVETCKNRLTQLVPTFVVFVSRFGRDVSL